MTLFSSTLYRSYFLFPFIIYFSSNLNIAIKGIFLGTLSLIYFFVMYALINKIVSFINKRYIIYLILLFFTFFINILLYLDLHYAGLFFSLKGSFFVISVLLIPFIVIPISSKIDFNSKEMATPLKKDKIVFLYNFIVFIIFMLLLSLLRELLTTGSVFYELQGSIYQISFIQLLNSLFHTNYLFYCPFFSSFIGGVMILSIFLLFFFKDVDQRQLGK